MDVVIRDGTLRRVQLRIYEPPRFFEAMLRGRAYTEPPDITARICGICPVAYQMSACNAIEALCGVTVDGPLADLRRLLYCGEWIESHTLHIYLLHAPDFLGYDGRHRPRRRPSGRRAAWPRAEEDRQRAGRADRWSGHPSRQRAGRWLLPGADRAGAGPASHPASSGPASSRSTPSGWVAGFEFPDHEWLGELVSLAHPGRVPDHAGPTGLDARPRHRSRRVRATTWSRSTSSTRPRCTPGWWTGASTCSARWPASPSTPTSSSPVAKDAADGGGAVRRRAQPLPIDRRPRRRGAVRVRRGAPDHRRLPRARRGCRGGRGPRRGRLRLDRGAPRDAVASVRVRRRGLHHQRSDRPADLAEPGRASSATCSTSSSTTSTSTTASSAAVPSRSSAATTRASRARRTSST